MDAELLEKATCIVREQDLMHWPADDWAEKVAEAVLRVAVEACAEELHAFARSKINVELIDQGLLLHQMANHLKRKFLAQDTPTASPMAVEVLNTAIASEAAALQPDATGLARSSDAA